MPKAVKKPPLSQDAPIPSQRLREAIALHEIEGNPLQPDEIAMFEMFEREGWSAEQCRTYILGLPE